MRVIAGEFRSRRLQTLPGLALRPTPDRLRETLFNVLAPVIEGAVFVDAYAGSGAVGIEALSRGAKRAVFIERNRGALLMLRTNLAALQLTPAADVVKAQAALVIEHYRSADIVFLDPPYSLEREYRACLETLGEDPAGLVIAQHASRFDCGENWGALTRTRVLKQGDNSLSFFKRNLPQV